MATLRDPNIAILCGSCAAGDHLCGGDCDCFHCGELRSIEAAAPSFPLCGRAWPGRNGLPAEEHRCALSRNHARYGAPDHVCRCGSRHEADGADDDRE